MHTITPPVTSPGRSRSRAATPAGNGPFRKPHYDCMDVDRAVQLTVYVPGVDAAGVEIATRGPDLVVTARKARFVRVNFSSLHIEHAQRDYQLRLRLGHGLDYAGLEAEIASGVLTLTLPKKRAEANAADPLDRARRVA